MVVLEQTAPAGSLADRRVLILNGSTDPLVPPDHPDRLATLLRTGGADVTVTVLAASHGLTPQDLAAAKAWLNTA
jgi:predicted esterase